MGLETASLTSGDMSDTNSENKKEKNDDEMNIANSVTPESENDT